MFTFIIKDDKIIMDLSTWQGVTQLQQDLTISQNKPIDEILNDINMSFTYQKEWSII